MRRKPRLWRYPAPYVRLYLGQWGAQLWKTSYRLRWWVGGLLALMGSGILGVLPLGALMMLVLVAAVGTLVILGGIKGAPFDPVSIEALWTDYTGLPYNPWRILRDRPMKPHPLWDAHRAWAMNILQGFYVPRIPWQWTTPTRIELAAVVVVGLLVTVGPGSVRDITTPLSQITGITQAPPLQAHVTLPEVLGFPTQTLPIRPFLNVPVGSTITVAFPTAQRFIPFVGVGRTKIRLYSKDGQTWTGHFTTPAYGMGRVHLGFVSVPIGNLRVISDQRPFIRWMDQPKTDGAGALILSYQMLDDFGLTAVMAHSRLVNPLNVAPAFRDVQSWVVQRFDNPPYPMGGPQETATLDGGESYAAGFKVLLALSARDAQGQIGETEVIQTVVWPLPTYHNPAAAALYEIRRQLIAEGSMAEALKSLSQTLPLLPQPRPSMFLAMKSLMLKLQRGAEDDRRPIVDLLWGVLQNLEPQNGLNQTQTIEAVLNQLMQAFLDPNQRAGLMKTLRQSLDQYFQHLETLMKQQGLMPPNSQFDLRPLDDFLNRLEETAQYGDPAKAARMIHDLTQMIRGMPKSQADLAAMKDLQKAMEDLGKLSEAQANLIKTLEDANGEPPPKAAAQQGALKADLERLQTTLARFGVDPMSMDKAKRAMAAAEADLKEASPRALPSMRRALEALNESSQQAMEQLNEQGRFLPMGMGGEGQQPIGPQADPNITIPQDTGSARLRQILKDIRDRVNQEEGTTRTYLQNLLKGE